MVLRLSGGKRTTKELLSVLTALAMALGCQSDDRSNIGSDDDDDNNNNNNDNSSGDADADSDSDADGCSFPQAGVYDWSLNNVVTNTSFQAIYEGKTTTLSMLDAHCDAAKVKYLLFAFARSG